MPSRWSDLGKKGEEAAVDWLRTNGFHIEARNYWKPYGEIDVIAKKDGIIAFVEVKTSLYFPDSAFPPEIRVNRRKIRNLKRICETYLTEANVSRETSWRVDVISVILNQDLTVREVNHIENAVFEEKY